MQPLQICIGPIIRIGRESWCLPYAGFFNRGPANYEVIFLLKKKKQIFTTKALPVGGAGVQALVVKTTIICNWQLPYNIVNLGWLT